MDGVSLALNVFNIDFCASGLWGFKIFKAISYSELTIETPD